MSRICCAVFASRFSSCILLGLRCCRWNRMRNPSWASGESSETRHTHAIYSPRITFVLQTAPLASAFPPPDRPGSVLAAEAAAVKCINHRYLQRNAGSSLLPMEWLLGLPEGSRAKRCPGSDPLPVSRVSATHPNPAWRPKPSSLSGPRFLQTCTRPSREAPRSLPVVPLIQIRGTTGRLRWGYQGMSGR